jgi:RNA polymerase sigma-70 factor (ECF subfamily)
MERSRAAVAPEERFEALYAEHYGRVLGYVLRRAPAAAAADVVADVFLVAWRRLESVPDQPLPWLLGVARKTLANERRGGRRRAALVDALRETSRDDSGTDVLVSRRLQVLARAVDRLGATDRELLRLIAWDGLTTREAATVLGITHSACRVRLHRVRRRLGREIGAQSESRTTSSSVAQLDAGKEPR